MTTAPELLDPLALIEEAWSLRFNGRTTDAETLVFALEKRSDLEPLLAWQVRLLRASIWRAKGSLSASNALLDELAEKIFSEQARAPYQYYVQRAMNLFSADEFSAALEFCLLADSVATNSSERLISLINILACLDNLNLPWSSTLTDLEKLARETKPTALSAPVYSQLITYHQRRALRDGRFAELFAQPLQDRVDQSHFCTLWASALPYVKALLPGSDALLQKFVLSPEFHAKAYRLKTILADQRMHAAAADTTITNQQVDRLYLWTWNWLSDPSETHRKNLGECLQLFDFSSALKKMTFEDFQMMRNALSWIALFQKALAPSIEHYLANITVTDCQPFALFEYEWELLARVRAELAGRMMPSVQSPLHLSEDLQLNELTQKLTLLLKERSRVPVAPVVINEETHLISWAKKSLVSPPIAQILLAISSRETLSFSEALWIGFKIAPYDHDVHAPKIQNSLARIKEIVPKKVSIKTRDGIIYWQGPRDLISRVSSRPHERRLVPENFEFSSAPSKRAFEKPVHPRTIVDRTGGKQLLTREEIQAAMGLSKASTNRWIQKWQAQGLIKRQGAGRSIVYNIDIADHYRLSDFD